MVIKIKWQNIEFYLKVNSSVISYYIAEQYQSDIDNQIKYQYGYYELVSQIMQQLRFCFVGISLLAAHSEVNTNNFHSFPLELEIGKIGAVEFMLFCPSSGDLSRVLCHYFARKSPLSLNSNTNISDISVENPAQPIWDEHNELSYPLLTGVAQLSPQEFAKLEVGDAVILQEIEPFIQLGHSLYVILECPVNGITTVKGVNYHEG